MGKEAAPWMPAQGGRCEMSHPPTPTPLSRGCAKGVTDVAKPRGLGGGAAVNQGLENKLLERPGALLPQRLKGWFPLLLEGSLRAGAGIRA